MLVKDIMTKDVISFKPDDSLASVARTFVENKISAGPVVDDEGTLLGIVSESDLLDVLEYHDELSTELLTWFPGYGDRWAFEKDMKEAGEFLKEVQEGKVKDVMTKDVVVVHPEDEASVASEAMELKKVNHIPVVNDDGMLVGIVARADVIRAIMESGT